MILDNCCSSCRFNNDDDDLSDNADDDKGRFPP